MAQDSKPGRRPACFGLPAVLVMLTAASAASAQSGGSPRLSPAQAVYVAQQIATLRSPQERALASDWSDAKKAAELICRPLALETLKREQAAVDRVFLGTDDPSTLRLVSERRLEGEGQMRLGSAWRQFNFVCGLNPDTGKATTFALTPPEQDFAPTR